MDEAIELVRKGYLDEAFQKCETFKDSSEEGKVDKEMLLAMNSLLFLIGKLQRGNKCEIGESLDEIKKIYNSRGERDRVTQSKIRFPSFMSLFFMANFMILFIGIGVLLSRYIPDFSFQVGIRLEDFISFGSFSFPPYIPLVIEYSPNSYDCSGCEKEEDQRVQCKPSDYFDEKRNKCIRRKGKFEKCEGHDICESGLCVSIVQGESISWMCMEITDNYMLDGTGLPCNTSLPCITDRHRCSENESCQMISFCTDCKDCEQNEICWNGECHALMCENDTDCKKFGGKNSKFSCGDSVCVDNYCDSTTPKIRFPPHKFCNEMINRFQSRKGDYEECVDDEECISRRCLYKNIGRGMCHSGKELREGFICNYTHDITCGQGLQCLEGVCKMLSKKEVNLYIVGNKEYEVRKKKMRKKIENVLCEVIGNVENEIEIDVKFQELQKPMKDIDSSHLNSFDSNTLICFTEEEGDRKYDYIPKEVMELCNRTKLELMIVFVRQTSKTDCSIVSSGFRDVEKEMKKDYSQLTIPSNGIINFPLMKSNPVLSDVCKVSFIRRGTGFGKSIVEREGKVVDLDLDRSNYLIKNDHCNETEQCRNGLTCNIWSKYHGKYWKWCS